PLVVADFDDEPRDLDAAREDEVDVVAVVLRQRGEREAREVDVDRRTEHEIAGDVAQIVRAEVEPEQERDFERFRAAARRVLADGLRAAVDERDLRRHAEHARAVASEEQAELESGLVSELQTGGSIARVAAEDRAQLDADAQTLMMLVLRRRSLRSSGPL